jgi:hypothetical protein
MRLAIWGMLVGLAVVSSVHAEVYKCQIGGRLVYQNMPCPEQRNSLRSADSALDGWKYGTTISEMKQQAQYRQLPMAPGRTPAYQGFSHTEINKKPAARQYTYKTQLMGKRANVTLFFSQASQLLYQIEARFPVAGESVAERKYFYESLHAKLSKKYGKAKHIKTDAAKKAVKDNPLATLIVGDITSTFTGSLQAWNAGKDKLVTLSYKKKYELMTSYRLNYKNGTLVNRHQREVAAEIKQRNDRALSNDEGRL